MTTPLRFHLNILIFTLATIGVCCVDASSTSAQGTGWSPVIVATGQYRQQIKSMPIEQRPNRPFHFYGNAVRRSYHQGGAFPTGSMSVGQYPTQSSPYAVGRPPVTYSVPSVPSYTPGVSSIVAPSQSW